MVATLLNKGHLGLVYFTIHILEPCGSEMSVAECVINYCLVAQLVEQGTVNAWVVRSNRT